MSTVGQLTLKQLRTFVAVYHLRKLAAAAERLAVTQSAVSVLLRQIETTLGIKLFDRTTRSLAPTQAAHEAIGAAERILQEAALLEASFRDMGGRRRGRVRLAVTPTIGMVLMPPTLRKFARDYPDIQVIIDDCAPDQFMARILNDQVEFGIGTPEGASAEIETATLIDDHLCVVCTANHALARRRQVRWSDLKGVPLIAVRPGYGVRHRIDQVVGKIGINPNVVNEVAFLTSALWMVSSELGVSILPSALATHSQYDNLVVRPLARPKVSRAISLVTKRGRSLSPACQSFTAMLAQDLTKVRGS